MKKRIFTLGVMALLFVACSVKEMDIATPTAKDAEEFFATIEDASTRVFVDDDLMVLWHADDRVSIFNKYTYNQQYRFTGNTGANSGSFTKVPNDDFVTGNTLNSVYAIYPYKESTEISNQGVLTIDLPATQSYAENSFGIGANTMVSCSEGNELLFKNLCGYIMLKLYGDDVNVKSISIKGNNDEPLAGKATVNASVDNAPSLTFDASATKEITLSFDTPVTLGATAETATTFWLVVPPTTFSKGITLTVKDDKNGEFKKTTTVSLQVSRNTLKRLTALPVSPEPSDDAIIFADENIKVKLVESFDTNGDGEISYKEAAAVTSIENAFGDNKTYVSFDEFKFFSSVTEIPDYCFQNWKDLASIVLPQSIKSIGAYAFAYCKSLSSIDIPESVSTIGAVAFRNCNSLISFVIPEKVEYIERWTFAYCSKLTSVVIPKDVLGIGADAFEGCSNLISINLPEKLTRIENNLFDGCSSLSSIVIPETVTSIGRSAFAKCSALTSIRIPERVTEIDDWAFSICSALTELYCLSETPPSGTITMFNGTTCPIYVPMKSVNSYKTAENWSNYSHRIQAIPPEAIDLGLPSGLKWASFNLGASRPEEYGDYYAWGETEPKSHFTLDAYTFNGEELGQDNDAAHVMLGGKWRMPTIDEIEELINECSWMWTSIENLSGYMVTGSNGRSIFLPAAGRIDETGVYNVSTIGYYWSSTLSDDGKDKAKYLYIGLNEIKTVDSFRYIGRSIRPVSD